MQAVIWMDKQYKAKRPKKQEKLSDKILDKIVD